MKGKYEENTNTIEALSSKMMDVTKTSEAMRKRLFHLDRFVDLGKEAYIVALRDLLDTTLTGDNTSGYETSLMAFLGIIERVLSSTLYGKGDYGVDNLHVSAITRDTSASGSIFRTFHGRTSHMLSTDTPPVLGNTDVFRSMQ